MMADSMAEGGVNANLDFKSGPQDLPTEGPENTYDFGIGGFDTENPDSDDESNESERPTPPNPDAQIGTPLDYDSIAAYTYGEFPISPQGHTDFAGALRSRRSLPHEGG